MLFNIFVEPLLKILKEKKITAYFFADDLIIIGTQEELKQASASIEDWASVNNMVVNKSKCGIINMEGEKFTG